MNLVAQVYALTLGLEERIRAMDLPIGMGDEKQGESVPSK
jgi:hypothetical protein